MDTLMGEILKYSSEAFGTKPDHPFAVAPDYFVLRHEDTRKWFALFMNIPRSRLGLNGDDIVWILNIKCDPLLSGSLRMQIGYFPAYHMKHDGWITILLDGTVPLSDIAPLLDMSYELTDKKK